MLMDTINRVQHLVSTLDIDTVAKASSFQEKLRLFKENSANVKELVSLINEIEDSINNMSFLEYYEDQNTYRDLQHVYEMASLPGRNLNEIFALLSALHKHSKSQQAEITELN